MKVKLFWTNLLWFGLFWIHFASSLQSWDRDEDPYKVRHKILGGCSRLSCRNNATWLATLSREGGGGVRESVKMFWIPPHASSPGCCKRSLLYLAKAAQLSVTRRERKQ